MAALFGAAIDHAKVRIHNGRHLPFQPKNCAMTPNGWLYFHHACFLDDYSAAEVHAQHWLAHEIVRLWRSAHHKWIAPTLTN
jgi:hypothetical protein